jgi:hypothetical protein
LIPASTLDPRSLPQGRRGRARRFARPRALRQRRRRLCDGRTVSGTYLWHSSGAAKGVPKARVDAPCSGLGRGSVLIDLSCRVHGSAPDIEGKNIANPIASIRCVVSVLVLVVVTVVAVPSRTGSRSRITHRHHALSMSMGTHPVHLFMSTRTHGRRRRCSCGLPSHLRIPSRLRLHWLCCPC